MRESKKFRLVDGESEEIHIIWLRDHVRNFLALPANLLVMQYPYESSIVTKDLLPLSVRKFCQRAVAEGSHSRSSPSPLLFPDLTVPEWYLPAFDLSTELHFFVKFFYQLSQKDDGEMENRLWVVKPAQNSGCRSIIVTRSLVQMLRAVDRTESDWIVQKYVENPLLVCVDEKSHEKFKCDVRMYVSLRQACPLDAYLHCDYYVRRAKLPYSTEPFSFVGAEYGGTHLTSYWNEADRDEAGRPFFSIEKSTARELIVQSLARESALLASFSSAPVEKGEQEKSPDPLTKRARDVLSDFFSKTGMQMGTWPRSRSVYGIDLLPVVRKDESGQMALDLKILEVNYCPDFRTISSYEPDFVSTVFEVLFDEPKRLVDSGKVLRLG